MTTDTSLELIQDLDFNPDITCEAAVCEQRGRDTHPGDWWYRSHCCGVIAICDGEAQRYLRIDFPFTVCVVCEALVSNIGSARLLGPVRP